MKIDDIFSRQNPEQSSDRDYSIVYETNRINSGVAEVASSSVAAERPRDDSCPSVVSFYSVILQNTSRGVFYYCYLGFIFNTAYN